ncbi:MAG: cobalamin-binding protein [Acidimicrobiales bacterium]|nr:cobalamin-binding protein [Acidimicrobiales bacterium]
MIDAVDAPAAVAAYLDLAVLGRTGPAARFVLDLLDRGATAETVIVDVLAAAQHETGERWQRNEWSVADEHLVSGVTQRALDAVASAIGRPAVAGSVVVACAEGDWHSLPAQMGAELLRARGLAVSFLGASTSADHVARLLVRDRPDAVIITCNLPLYFPGVIRLADAAHRCGVPVVVGGRAVPSLSRAVALGADAWASEVSAVAPRIATLTCPPCPDSSAASLDPAAVLLDLDSSRLAAQASELMIAAHPFMRSFNDEQLARTREDLAFTVRFVAAAVIVRDRSVVTEYLGWLCALLVARGVPTTAVLASLEALIPLVTVTDAAAGELARVATDEFFR